jgi:RNA polymerase sigma factor (TIGR02999 family)
VNGNSPEEITGLLLAWGDGDHHALDRLMPLVHAELQRVAHRYLRRRQKEQTLQTSDLVNEAYIRLIDASRVKWQSRAHFFAVAAQLMRRILVDAARERHSKKRGGDATRVTFDEELNIAAGQTTDLVKLDDALKTLATLNPRHSLIVELRFFGGLREEEVAEVLNISERTVRREWSLARAWLYREVSGIS